MKLVENHPFFTVTPEIDSICAPLKQHHLTHFVYLRSYANGSRFYLSNMVKPLKAYLAEEHYRFGYCEAKPNTYSHDAVLWSTAPNQHIFQFRRTNFNLDHGMSLSVKHDDFSEFYSFCAPKEHVAVLNFYLNNLDYLRAFAVDFNHHAARLLQQFEAHKIVLPHREHTHTSLQLGTIFHKDTQQSIQLTHRLWQCFCLIMQGKTARDIGQELQLSTRTIEDYTAIIHKRLGCKSSKELIASYHHQL